MLIEFKNKEFLKRILNGFFEYELKEIINVYNLKSTQKILKYLKTNKNKSIQDISRDLVLSYKSTHQSIKRLEEFGFIKITDHGCGFASSVNISNEKLENIFFKYLFYMEIIPEKNLKIFKEYFNEYIKFKIEKIW